MHKVACKMIYAPQILFKTRIKYVCGSHKHGTKSLCLMTYYKTCVHIKSTTELCIIKEQNWVVYPEAMRMKHKTQNCLRFHIQNLKSGEWPQNPELLRHNLAALDL